MRRTSRGRWRPPTGSRFASRASSANARLDALCRGDLVVDRVRRALPMEEGFRNVEQVATVVHMSSRTLKRRLAEQGVTFSSLVDEERRDRALLLLRTAQRSVNEVARQLGYSTLPGLHPGVRPLDRHHADGVPAPPGPESPADAVGLGAVLNLGQPTSSRRSA